MPDKPTDGEILKALECCVSEQYTCGDCPYQEIKHYSDDEGFEIMPNGKWYDDWSCERWLNVDLLDLINRLQAENERLLQKTQRPQDVDPMDFCGVLCDFAEGLIAKAKAEAYKEFADRLKDMSEHFWEEKENFVSEEQIDNLLKELVGENND